MKDWDKMVVMSDQEIRKNLYSDQFQRFFDNHSGSEYRFAVAWLSRISVDEHLEKHPEVMIDDYRAIPYIPTGKARRSAMGAALRVSVSLIVRFLAVRKLRRRIHRAGRFFQHRRGRSSAFSVCQVPSV
jgi:hypothetical protein